MGTVVIINNSTLTDYAALMRVGSLLSGDAYQATHNAQGDKVVSITQQPHNTYLVTDDV